MIHEIIREGRKVDDTNKLLNHYFWDHDLVWDIMALLLLTYYENERDLELYMQ